MFSKSSLKPNIFRYAAHLKARAVFTLIDTYGKLDNFLLIHSISHFKFYKIMFQNKNMATKV
jgi:hypothetical protein